jgi:hypothetical protein
MAEYPWRIALRQRWREECSNSFTHAELDAALEEVALFRSYAERLDRESLALEEVPFAAALRPSPTRAEP